MAEIVNQAHCESSAIDRLVGPGYIGVYAKRWFKVYPLVRILGMSEVREAVLTNGAEANPSSSEELQNFVRSEVIKWTAAAKAAGMTPQF